MDIGQNLRYRKYRKVLEITLSFPLLVGNLFQLHHPHQIWLRHEYGHYRHY